MRRSSVIGTSLTVGGDGVSIRRRRSDRQCLFKSCSTSQGEYQCRIRACRLVALSGVAMALTLAPARRPITLKYKADLNGPSENPPTTSKGVGSIEADYDTATKMLSWSGTYSDLTGPEAAAHFHGPAAVGVNAGVMVPVDAKASPFKGSAVLDHEQAKASRRRHDFISI